MHQVILTIVEKGRAEAVIDAAVKARSHGRNIVDARDSGVRETASLFGFSIEPEKELVLVLVKDTRVRDIVVQVSTGLRLDEPGSGIVFIQDSARVHGLCQANGQAQVVSTNRETQRVFIGKLGGTTVFDPIGDPMGKVYNVVILLYRHTPLAIGLVMEVTRTHRAFVPITRVASVKPDVVVTTGLVNLRRFQAYPLEACVISGLLDHEVNFADGSGRGQVMSIAIEQQHNGTQLVTQVHVARLVHGVFHDRLGESLTVDLAAIQSLGVRGTNQAADTLLANLGEMKSPSMAEAPHDLPETRMVEVAAQSPDGRLADVPEELEEHDQVRIVSSLEPRRVANVLDVMQPDDAASLVAELPRKLTADLLELMEPEEAKDVRRLLACDEETIDGLMTTEPVMLAPDDSVATILVHVQRRDILPALVAMAMICHPPLETPTGKFIGVMHLQRALHEPPSTQLENIIDTDLEGVTPDKTVDYLTRTLATYNLTVLSVVGPNTGSLLGAVSVDDVLDHLLPEDQRQDDRAAVEAAAVAEAETAAEVDGADSEDVAALLVSDDAEGANASPSSKTEGGQ